MGDSDSLFDKALQKIDFSIGGYRVELFNWGKLNPVNWSNPLHHHSFFEICCVYKGEGTFYWGEDPHHVTRGNVVCAFPEENHSMIADKRNPFGVYCASIGIFPERENDAGDDDSEHRELVTNFLTSTVRVVMAQGFERICSIISHDMNNTVLAYELALRGLFIKFAVELMNIFGDAPAAGFVTQTDRDHPEDIRLNKLLLYIHNHYYEPLRVDLLAKRIFLSSRQINRIFRRHFGMSTQEYIVNYRMKMAQQMLDNTVRPIKEVAAACGYPNVRHFMTVFRERNGVTAKEFRIRRSCLSAPPSPL